MRRRPCTTAYNGYTGNCEARIRMKVYYNDNDPFVCAWLFQLMRAGEIPKGEIDSRGIAEVSPSEVGAFKQAHFFAGIGGWAYALRLAGWGSRSVWTGSCPCQPFSSAGKRQGTKDDRHLWPEFRCLIAKCSPPTIFGEQVASKDGRLWLSGVRSDLEALGYGVGAADLCAAGVEAPHIRQRLFWVADSESSKFTRQRAISGGEQSRSPNSSRIGNANGSGSQGCSQRPVEYANQRTPWSASELIYFTDGKSRRIELGTFPLAHGVPSRVGRLRGYGNAIVPYVAAEFISSFLDIEGEVV